METLDIHTLKMPRLVYIGFDISLKGFCKNVIVKAVCVAGEKHIESVYQVRRKEEQECSSIYLS